MKKIGLDPVGTASNVQSTSSEHLVMLGFSFTIAKVHATNPLSYAEFQDLCSKMNSVDDGSSEHLAIILLEIVKDTSFNDKTSGYKRCVLKMLWDLSNLDKIESCVKLTVEDSALIKQLANEEVASGSFQYFNPSI